MESWYRQGCLIALIGAVLALFNAPLKTASLAAEKVLAAPSSSGVLTVSDLMKNVDHHRQGPVRVEGVVSTLSPEQQSLTLIDTREFQECGVTTCAALSLPVRWTGSMPRPQEIVRVEGEVGESEGKLILHAQTLEKVTPQLTK